MRCGLAVGTMVVALAIPVEAQVIYGPRMATRAELTTTLDSLQRMVPIADDEKRDELLASIDNIERRLNEGDIWPGDVIELRVTGEDRWTGPQTVTPLRQIELEDIQPFDVSGLLHAELEEALSRHLSTYLREPRLEAQALKRVGIMGSVARPGFYTVQGSTLISDLLMQAGGPGTRANIDEIEFRRLGEELEVGEQVVWQSLTLDQLGVQSGDEVYVPQQSSGLGGFLLGALGVIGSVTFILIRVF